MSDSFDDAAFWLPTQILDDHDDVVLPAMDFTSYTTSKTNKNGATCLNGGFGFDADASRALFPFEFPYGGEYGGAFGGVSSDLNSPVESSETESDEEDYLAGLTRQLARSSLEDDFKGYDKGWVSSGSPQSTLCAVGSGCGCGGQGSSRGSPNAQTAPAATWDLLHAAAGEVAKMRMNQCKGLLGPPTKPSNNPDFAYFLQQQQQQQQSLSQKHFQAAQFQRLRQQQQMMKDQSRYPQQLTRTSTHQMVSPRVSHAAVNTRPLLGLSPSAWPSLQAAQPKQQRSPSGFRAGTGVFIPMANSSRPEPPRKKQGCPKVYLPARVVQALKLNIDDMVNPQLQRQQQQPQLQRNFDGRFTPDYEVALRLRSTNSVATANAALSQQKLNIRPPMTNEIRLPQEWTY